MGDPLIQDMEKDIVIDEAVVFPAINRQSFHSWQT